MADFIPSPTQDDILVALRSFLISILPDGIEVVQAQENRVPEPFGNDFVTITPMFMQRLATNTDTYQDVSFTGSISGTTLSVTAVAFGVLAVGQMVFGIGVSSGSRIISLGTGLGGIGTYNLNNTQTVTSRKIASGGEYFLQPVKVTMQVDVHGPASSENAQTISTLFRDDYAVQAFKQSGFDIVPITADDPRQLPFTNEQQQVENRWSIDAVMQANQVIRISTQFADQLVVNVINVEATYPAT